MCWANRNKTKNRGEFVDFRRKFFLKTKIEEEIAYLSELKKANPEMTIGQTISLLRELKVYLDA